jgi:hypothetical protein
MRQCIPCEKEHNGECYDTECRSNTRYCAKVTGATRQRDTDQLVVNELEAEIQELKERIGFVQTSILGMDEIEIIDCYGHRVKYKKIDLQEIGNGRT